MTDATSGDGSQPSTAAKIRDASLAAAGRVATIVGVVLGFLISLFPVVLLTRWDPTGFWLIPYYIVMIALALAGVVILSTARGREWITSPKIAGNAFPYGTAAWIAIGLIILAFDLFATYTWEVLGDDGRLIATGGFDLSQARLADFYLWHSLEFVPFLKITETLDWQTPVTYTGGAVGWLLLIFKGAIVVPVVLAFRSFVRTRGEGVSAETA